MIRSSRDESPYNNYARIKIGNKAYDDATLDLKILKKQKEKYYLHKDQVLKALAENDICTLREISNYFYRQNNILHLVICMMYQIIVNVLNKIVKINLDK